MLRQLQARGGCFDMSWLTFLVLVPLVQEAPSAPIATDEPLQAEADQERVPDAPPEPEEEPAPRAVVGGGEVTLATAYVFRGVPQYPSMTTPSIQPAVYVDFDRVMPGHCGWTSGRPLR